MSLGRNWEWIPKAWSELADYPGDSMASGKCENFPFQLLSGCQPKIRIWIISLFQIVDAFFPSEHQIYGVRKSNFAGFQCSNIAFRMKNENFEKKDSRLKIALFISVSFNCLNYIVWWPRIFFIALNIPFHCFEYLFELTWIFFWITLNISLDCFKYFFILP